MAHINPQGIQLGMGPEIGLLSVNGGAIFGEGGAVHPRIVIPLKVEMSPQPEGAMIAIISLTASLGARPNASPAQVLAQPVTRQLLSGFRVASQRFKHEYTEDLRFILTQAEVEDLEALRHDTGTDEFTLHLDLDLVVAAIKSGNKQESDSPWDHRFGMFAEVYPFYTARVQPLQINIEQSTWVNKVLPGLGYDELRLVELTFPPSLPDDKSAAGQFDQAKRALDQRRYGDCIKECRGLLNMWEKQYKTTKERHLAEVIAAARSWPENDVRRQLLDTLWKEVGDVANAPHHPESDVDAELFERRDARLIFLLTSALSEYVSEARSI